MLVPRPLLFGAILVLASLGGYSLNQSHARSRAAVRRRRDRVRDARARRSARARRAGAHPRPAGRAAVPARARDQPGRFDGVRDAADFPRRPVARRRRPAWSAPRRAMVAGWRTARDVETRRTDDHGRRRRVGGGNAGLCAAICGARNGRERDRAGVCAACLPRRQQPPHAQSARCMHDAPTDLLPEAYPESEYCRRSCCVSPAADTDEALAAPGRPAFGRVPGVDAPPRRAISVVAARHVASRAGPTRSSSEAARRCMNTYYAAAERLGVQIAYDAEVVGLDLADGPFRLRSRANRRHGDQVTARAVGGRLGRIRSPTSSGCGKSGARRPTISSSAARRTTEARVLRMMLDAGAESRSGMPDRVMPSRSMLARPSSTAAS